MNLYIELEPYLRAIETKTPGAGQAIVRRLMFADRALGLLAACPEWDAGMVDDISAAAYDLNLAFGHPKTGLFTLHEPEELAR